MTENLNENLSNDKSILKVFQEFCQLRNKPLLLLNLEEIDKQNMLRVHDLMCKRHFDDIDVILQTPGGDIDSAYMITKIIKQRAKNISIIVPLYAKSAGTLICLGGNDLILTAISELGPLDTQIFEQKDGGQAEYSSALNGFKALQQVQKHTLETLDITTKLIISRSAMRIAEAVKLSAEFSGQTSGVLYKKLDPYKIGEYARALEIGEKYGSNILTRYMGWNKKRAENALDKLVRGYPSHSFAIDVEELIALGFPASYIEGKYLDSVLNIRSILLSANSDIISLFTPNKKKIDLKKQTDLKNKTKIIRKIKK